MMSDSSGDLSRLGQSGETHARGRGRPSRPASPLVLLFAAPASRLVATYRRGLEVAGHQVTHTTSSAAAIAAALERRPDLVVLDTELSDANQVLWWLRSLLAEDGSGELPVVMLTGGDADQLPGEAVGPAVAGRLPRASTSPYGLARWVEEWSRGPVPPNRGTRPTRRL